MTVCISIFFLFIGDIIVNSFMNKIIFKNIKNPKSITKIHWFLGNIITYINLTLLYYNYIGNTYFNINDHSLLYTFLTIPINLFLIDTFFYFIHRFAHINIIYNNAHYFHHKFRPINSWVARYSHWVDSNLENIAFTCPFFIVPTYCPLIYIILVGANIWSCYIHNSGCILNNKYINDSKCHSIHHKFGKKNYNFALFFTFWDKLFNTYYPKNENI